MPVAPVRPAWMQPTARAQQVMDLRCQGLSYRQIEARLGIARTTVGVYVQMVYEYLGTHDPARAKRLWSCRQEPAAPGQWEAPCDLI